MASLIVILVVIPLVLRAYARRVEKAVGDVPDKVHRIRKAQMAAILVLPVLEVLVFAEAYGEGQLLISHHGPILSARHDGAAVAAAGLLVFFALFVGGSVLCYLATYPATARIRGLPSQAGRAGKRQARMIFVVLVPQLIWVTLWVVAVHAMHGVTQLALLPLWIAFTVGMVVFGPLLMRAILPTRPVDDGVRQRLLRLASEHRVKIRDIRCMDTGPEQTANAMVIGLLPRIRYVLITDSLLRDLEPDELDAVLAHELGHAKKHHLLIKLGAVFVAWLPAAGIIAALAALGGHRSAALIVVGTVLAMVLIVASLLLAQGVVGLRLERSADDYASATAGPDALRRALEKLAAANATKRRTGRMWNVLTQHPGMDQRIARLRKASAHPSGSVMYPADASR
jgi:Zn-dependent protease with chaperone function